MLTGAPFDAPSDVGNLETLNRLLDATIHIANVNGLDKVTYRSVATEAGLSHSLVRFYFGTREAMITAALERATRLDAEEGGLLADDLESFGSDVVRSISGDRSTAMLQYDYLLRAVRGGVPTSRVVALYDYYVSQIVGTLTNIGFDDPDASYAALVFAALDGIVLQHHIYGSNERTELLMDRLRELVRVLQASRTSNGEPGSLPV